MLVHYFWLLEFKFKFEFNCLKPFPKIPKFLKPLPIQLSNPARQRCRPPQPANGFRPASRAGCQPLAGRHPA
jgi:hypothetical protein